MSEIRQPKDESLRAMDFLTPEQRREAIAQILATVGLRMLKADHEQDETS